MRADKFVNRYKVAKEQGVDWDKVRSAHYEQDDEMEPIVVEAVKEIHLALLRNGSKGMQDAMHKVLVEYGQAVIEAWSRT